jgi:DHA1 family tetracycline resistance protein-like MFS transporter
VSLLGTAAGWAIFIFAFYFREYFLPIIFFARIVDGVTAGNIATAQSYLVDIARNDKERTTNLGLMGAAFGVGFVIGPALGGALSQIIPLMPFYFATALGLINALAAFLFLQETHHRRSTKKMTLNPFVPMIKVLKHHHMRFLFLIWFLLTLAFSNFQSIFTLYTKMQYNANEITNGWLLALVGFIVLINQGFMLKRFWLRFFKEPQLEIIAGVMLLISFVFMTHRSFMVLIVTLVLSAFAQSLLRVVINSQVAGSAPAREKGEVLGTLQSFAFLSAVVAPVVGGWALQINLALPWWICVGYTVAALLMILWKKKEIAKIHLSETSPTI